jgi:CelD/BcsL family acetyltransferase involved in cellulose biosynthesis
MSASIQVRISEASGRVNGLRQEWAQLFNAAERPSPFLSWEWLSTWWRVLGTGRRLRLLEARQRSSGKLVGLLALTADAAGRNLALLGNGIGGADGLDMLVHPAWAEETRAALAAMVAAMGWDALALEDLPRGSPAVEALIFALDRAGARTAVERRFHCPTIALSGSFARWLAGVRRGETLARRRRWWSRRPGHRVELATPEQTPAAMEDLLRLHRMRWEGAGGSYGIPGPLVERFHREVAPLLAEQGWLRLYRLFDGSSGAPAIAAIYGLELGRRFHFYQSGYHPAWAARSPGLVLLSRALEDAFERGLSDFELLRGAESYKLDWASGRRETVTLRASAPGWRGELARARRQAKNAVRVLARQMAPAPLWAALVMARRRQAGGGTFLGT